MADAAVVSNGRQTVWLAGDGTTGVFEEGVEKGGACASRLHPFSVEVAWAHPVEGKLETVAIVE